MLSAVSFRDAIFWFVTSKTLWSKNSVSWEKVYANHLITCQSWLPWVSRHSLQIKMWLKKHDYSTVLLLPCFMELIYSCDWSVWIKTCYSTEELTRAFLVITLIPGSPGKPMLPTGPMSPWKEYSIHKTESHNLQEYILANYITGRTQRTDLCQVKPFVGWSTHNHSRYSKRAGSSKFTLRRQRKTIQKRSHTFWQSR